MGCAPAGRGGRDVGRRDLLLDPGQSQARATPRDRGHGRPRLLAPRLSLLHLLRPHARERRQRDPSSEPRQRFRQGRRRPDRLQEDALRDAGPGRAGITASVAEPGRRQWRGARRKTMTTVNVRYMVGDVEAAVAFYTTYLGFTLISKTAPAFADVARGDLRLLLSGPSSSAGRPMPDGRRPVPGGWNRIHLIVEDLSAEVDRLRAAGVHFRNDIVTGPGGSQILLDDPSGNPIELFQSRRE